MAESRLQDWPNLTESIRKGLASEVRGRMVESLLLRNLQPLDIIRIRTSEGKVYLFEMIDSRGPFRGIVVYVGMTANVPLGECYLDAVLAVGDHFGLKIKKSEAMVYIPTIERIEILEKRD